MGKLILIVLFLISINAHAEQDLKLTFGLGTPLIINGLFETDIRDSNGVLWNSQDHVIGSFIVTMPTEIIDYSCWHHSILNDWHDAGVTGCSVSKTLVFKIW